MMDGSNQPGRNRKTRALWLFGFCLTGAGGGCLTVEQMAPPVTTAFTRQPTDGVTLAVLEQGRSLYLQDCTRCHSVEPIVRYSKERWAHIIERMAPQSKLDKTRTAALQAYVFAAHDVLANGVGNETARHR